MKEVINMLLDSIKNGKMLPAIAIVFISLIFNFRKLVDFFEDRKKAKIGKLNEALNCSYIQGINKAHLEDELSREYFKLCTGIGVEKEFREAIIQTHRQAKGELDFIHFKRALPHLYFKDSKIFIEITNFEKFTYWIDKVFGWTLMFYGWLLFLLIMLPGKENSPIDFIKNFGFVIFFFVIGFIILLQTRSVISAKKIQELIKESLNKSAEIVKITGNVTSG